MGRFIMFMLFMWLMIVIAAGVMEGDTHTVRTHLTQALSETASTIHVPTTSGFASTGKLTIGGEKISYSSKTSTTFRGNPARPLMRGVDGTDATTHSVNDQVTTVEGGMLNDAAGYNVSVLTDSSGAMAFITKPLAFFALLGSLFTAPLDFLGTDLEIFTYLWAVLSIGIIAAIMIQMAGGRRI